MELEGIGLSEIRQKETVQYQTISVSCGTERKQGETILNDNECLALDNRTKMTRGGAEKRGSIRTLARVLGTSVLVSCCCDFLAPTHKPSDYYNYVT